MKPYYDVLIVGSTFAGLGAAYAARSNALVVERTAMVGHEFISSYHPGTDWLDTKMSKPGEKLKKEMIHRSILSQEGKIHLPAVMPLLYHQIKENNLPVLLLTEVVNIEKAEGGFGVELYNASGFTNCIVKRVIDTTNTCITDRSKGTKVLWQSINAELSSINEGEKIQVPNCEEIELVEGKLPGEIILKLKISPQDDWVDARQKLHQFWIKRPKELEKWSIAAVAHCLETVVSIGPMEIQPGWSWLPSSAYRNPLEAFEAGYEFVGKGEE